MAGNLLGTRHRFPDCSRERLVLKILESGPRQRSLAARGVAV